MNAKALHLEKMLKELEEQLGEKLSISVDDYFTWLLIRPESLLDLMLSLKTNYGFNYLANLTSVDYGEEFELVYHLYSIPDNNKVGVKTRVPRNQAQAESVMSIWPTADWQEREVFDLMGINFSNHANLVRVLLPDDFVGYPLRKDFKREG